MVTCGRLYEPVPAREPGKVLGVDVEISMEVNRRKATAAQRDKHALK